MAFANDHAPSLNFSHHCINAVVELVDDEQPGQKFIELPVPAATEQ